MSMGMLPLFSPGVPKFVTLIRERATLYDAYEEKRELNGGSWFKFKIKDKDKEIFPALRPYVYIHIWDDGTYDFGYELIT